MDVSTMSSMSMAMSPTSTSATSATSSAAMSMSMGGGCKISMLWNWYTVDACFISRTWRVPTPGVFALSCIGVILLTMSLEFLRRLQREHDRMIKRNNRSTATVMPRNSSSSSGTATIKGPEVTARVQPTRKRRTPQSTLIFRQFIRSLLHMVAFAVAYFIMLLAMYYNGYIIICIIIGAFLGAFIFSWDQLETEDRENTLRDVTGCCG